MIDIKKMRDSYQDRDGYNNTVEDIHALCDEIEFLRHEFEVINSHRYELLANKYDQTNQQLRAEISRLQSVIDKASEICEEE